MLSTMIVGRQDLEGDCSLYLELKCEINSVGYRFYNVVLDCHKSKNEWTTSRNSAQHVSQQIATILLPITHQK